MTSKESLSRWRKVSVADVAAVNPETTRGLADDHKIRYIDISSVNSSYRIADDLPEMRLGDAPSRAKRLVRKGDILFSMVRSERRSFAVVPSGYDQQVASTGFAVIRPLTDLVDPGYLWAAVRSPNFVAHIVSRQRGSNYPAVSAGDVADGPLSLPPVDEQRRIARVLDSLDEKIGSSLRLARAAEEVAAALFDATFVDFVGQTDLVESEIGPIPRGWSSTPVGDLARYVNGKAFTRFGNDRGRMVIRIAELRSGPGESTVYSDHETEPDFMAVPGDILFAWSGSLDVYRWHRPEALINQHIFKVIPEGYPGWFIFHVLKHIMPHFQAIAADKATTMGHIKRADLHSFSIAIPPDSDFEEHDAVLAPLFERVFVARREAEALAQVRDQVLPRLISGRLRVPAATDLAAEPA